MANIIIDLNPKNDEIIEQKWTYRDFDMPFDRQYSDNRDVSAVRGSLANIFGWRTGQRILDPNFGNVIYSFLYENMTDLTKQNIKKGVATMIGYEPRVGIVALDVGFNSERNEVRISLQYNIPSLNIEVDDLFIIT